MKIEIKKEDRSFGIYINEGDCIGEMEPLEYRENFDQASRWEWVFRPHGTGVEIHGRFECNAETAQAMLGAAVEAAHAES